MTPAEEPSAPVEAPRSRLSRTTTPGPPGPSDVWVGVWVGAPFPVSQGSAPPRLCRALRAGALLFPRVGPPGAPDPQRLVSDGRSKATVLTAPTWLQEVTQLEGSSNIF